MGHNLEKVYKTIGVVLEQNGNMMLLLDRTFNSAGVPVEEGKDKIVISMFDPPEQKSNSFEFEAVRGARDEGQVEIPF